MLCECGCGAVVKHRFARGHQLRTPDARRRMGDRHRGERNRRWKGGISKARDVFKASPEYKAWAVSVYYADRFLCQLCGVKCSRPEAHHIKPLRDYPAFALELTNGVTLCGKCHERTYGKEHKFEAILTVAVAKRVNSVNARPDGAEGNTEPSRCGNVAEGVETRGQAWPVDWSMFDKREVPCEVCGTMVMRHPYRLRSQKHHFCGNACKGVFQRTANKGKGSKRVIVPCSWCGTPCEKFRYQLKQNAVYCTMRCMGKATMARRYGGHAPTSALPERDDIVRAAEVTGR